MQLSRTIRTLAHVGAADVFQKSTQESVGHPSGAALHAVLKGDWPYFPGRSGLFARVEAAEVFLEFTQKTAEIDNLATQIDQALAKSAQLKSEVATLQNELAKLAAS